MARGGPRAGAGRPVGTTKEPTVMLQRRVKPEWIPIIDNLIKELRAKKALIILFILFTFTLPGFAFEYTIETARDEALKNVPKYCVFPNIDAFHRSVAINSWDEPSIVSKQIRTDNPNLLDVVYKETPAYKYTYKYSKSIGSKGQYYGAVVNVTYQQKNAINKIAAYKASTGKLMTVALNVSENEAYLFDMDGNLLGYINGSEHKRFKIPYSTIKKHFVMYSGQ